MWRPVGPQKACIILGIWWNALLSKRMSLHTFPNASAEMRLNGCTGTSQEIPSSSPKHPFTRISLLHIQLWGISMENWDQGICVLGMTVLPGVANVTTNPFHWSRSCNPPGALTFLQFLSEISSKRYDLPESKQRKIQGSPRSETIWFQTIGICF